MQNQEIAPRSHLSESKLEFLLRHMRITHNAVNSGLIIEVGIYKGGTLHEMASRLPWQRFIGYDTFEGLPSPSYYDMQSEKPHCKGDFSDVDMKSIVRHFGYLGIPIIQARFPNNVDDVPIMFAHLDVDLWYDTYVSLKYFEQNLLKGGRVVVDDYGWMQTPGVKNAVDLFVAKESNRINIIESNFEHQVVLEAFR